MPSTHFDCLDDSVDVVPKHVGRRLSTLALAVSADVVESKKNVDKLPVVLEVHVLGSIDHVVDELQRLVRRILSCRPNHSNVELRLKLLIFSPPCRNVLI